MIIDRISKLTTNCGEIENYCKGLAGLAEEMDMEYPPVAREIMWAHSFQNNRLIENINAIQVLDLP